MKSSGSLEELGEVRLRLAETVAERPACAHLLEAGHPLGRAPGCRLTYLLEAGVGPVGVLSFVAAPLRLGPRDERLGWDERRRGLGPLKEWSSSARGLFVHAAAGFTQGRRPLGVSGLQSWARPEQEREKESRRWFRGVDQGRELGRASPGMRVVVVGDRESDIYELLQRQSEHREEAGLVVRANASRQRKVQAWNHGFGAAMIRTLESQPDFEQPVKTGRKVFIDSQGGVDSLFISTKTGGFSPNEIVDEIAGNRNIVNTDEQPGIA